MDSGHKVGGKIGQQCSRYESGQASHPYTNQEQGRFSARGVRSSPPRVSELPAQKPEERSQEIEENQITRRLPVEVLAKIFSYMSLEDRAALLPTCKIFKDVCGIDAVLKNQIRNTPHRGFVPIPDNPVLNPDLLEQLRITTNKDWAICEPICHYQLADYLKFVPRCFCTLTRANRGRTYWITSLTALGNGQFASGSGDRTIKIWGKNQQGQWQCLHTLNQANGGHTDWVTCLTALGNGQFASGSNDKSIKIWRQNQQGLWLCLHTLNQADGGHTGGVKSLIALGNGRLASGSLDETIKIWGQESGGELAMPSHFASGERRSY